MELGAVISFLLTLLLFGALCYAVYLVINLIPLPPQLKTIVLIIFGIIAVLLLLSMFFPLIGSPITRWR